MHVWRLELLRQSLVLGRNKLLSCLKNLFLSRQTSEYSACVEKYTYCMQDFLRIWRVRCCVRNIARLARISSACVFALVCLLLAIVFVIIHSFERGLQLHMPNREGVKTKTKHSVLSKGGRSNARNANMLE